MCDYCIVIYTLFDDFVEPILKPFGFSSRPTIKAASVSRSWDDLSQKPGDMPCDLILVPDDKQLEEMLVPYLLKKRKIYLVLHKGSERKEKRFLYYQHKLGERLQQPVLYAHHSTGAVFELLCQLAQAFAGEKEKYENIIQQLLQAFEPDLEQEIKLELMHLSGSREGLSQLVKGQFPAGLTQEGMQQYVRKHPHLQELLKQMHTQSRCSPEYLRLRRRLLEILAI